MDTPNILQNIKKMLGKKAIRIGIIILVVFIIIVLISVSSDYLDVKNGLFSNSEDDPDYNEYCPASYFNNVYVANNGTLMAAMSAQDLWEHDTRYSQYLSSVEALSYLLNAQVVSQYPYIETAENNELNGTVKFYRNNSESPMKYVSKETLDSYISNYNSSGSAEDRDNALNSFAINNNGSIRVAYLKGEREQIVTNFDESVTDAEEFLHIDDNTSYTKNSNGSKLYTIANSNSLLYTTNISYRKVIQDYILPFELLWAIVVIGDNGSSGNGNSEDLAHAVASMAYDGEIKLIVDDNSTEVTTDEVTGFNLVKYNSYTDILLVQDGFVIGNGEDIDSRADVEPKHYVSTYTKIESTSAPVLRIRKIESWSAIYDKTPSYVNNISESPVEQDTSVQSTSSWKTEFKEDYSYKYSDCPVEGIVNQFNVNNDGSHEYSLRYSYKIRSRRENVTKTTSQNTVSKSYGNASSVTPSFNQDIADLIKVSSFSAVKGYITRSSYGSFMEVIEGNDATANLKDRIDYIFNEVTESTDYGEGLEWESIWKSTSSSSNSSSGDKIIAADTIQARIWFSLKDKGYSDTATAAVLGSIEKESNFRTDVENEIGAYGLCQWLDERKTGLQKYAESKGVEPSDETTQIEYLLAELEPGGGADGYATYQFSGFESYRDTWMNSNNIEEATNAFAAGFERPGGTEFPERVEVAKQYYNEFHGAKLSSNTGDGTIENSDTLGIKGYYTAVASGKKFTLYSQNISGSSWYWDCGCFVTSQATIASAYGSNLTPNQFSGWMGNGYVGDFKTKCGCNYKREYSITTKTMKQYLQEGKAIMIELKGVILKTDNGSEYYDQHFVSVIDYKNEDGIDKVYIHDPWEGSPSQGWANINDIVRVSACFDSVWK